MHHDILKRIHIHTDEQNTKITTDETESCSCDKQLLEGRKHGIPKIGHFWHRCS